MELRLTGIFYKMDYSTWMCILVMLDCGYTFNVDTRTALIHSGEANSYFGYAVAQHIDQGTTWLLVGAPKAETTQPKVERGGSVYRCRPDNTECQVIPFDLKGPNIQWNGSTFVDSDSKTDQWFGATIASSGKNGVIVACAPRYVYYSRYLNKREPVGTCYVSLTSSTTFREFSPCKGGGWGYHNQGHCQAGFSATLTPDGSRLVMGAVGSYYWQGQVFSQGVGEKWDKIESFEAPPIYDNSYMGYSIAVGEFTGDDIQDYVVGIPRADDLKGRVSIMMENLTSHVNVTGEQLGECFGYSVATADLNGDGYEDIAVGAPFYADYTADAYEIGMVYVFYQNSKVMPSHTNLFHENWMTRLPGPMKPKSRFGTSLSSLGDVNNDKIDDLVVGAPYAGRDARGAVYVYHGSATGVKQTPSQIIYAEDIRPDLRTFGFSLSGGSDMDGNSYPDLLIGAYESDASIFLRSRPIVKLAVDMRLEPRILKLNEKRCQTSDGTPVPCLAVTTCIMYAGAKVPNNIELEASWTLDTKVFTPRALFLGGTDKASVISSKVHLNRKMNWCKTTMAYVKDHIRDMLTPLVVNLQLRLVDNLPDNLNDLTPVLDEYIPTNFTAQGQIWKNCGDDNICIPDLSVKAETMIPYYLIGTGIEIDIPMKIQNRGEGAYEATGKVQLPAGVTYVRAHNIQANHEVRCGPYSEEQDDVIMCDLGNPLPAGDMVNLTLRVSASRVNGSDYSLRFLIHVNSSNAENKTDISNNFAVVDIPVRVVTDISLTGVSKPEQVLFNSTLHGTVRNEHEAGPQVVHLYEIRNLGPSSVESASLEIHWPSHIAYGADLLYLTVLPEVIEGTGTCTSKLVNHKNITVNSKRWHAAEAYAKESKRKRLKRDIRDETVTTSSIPIREMSCEAGSELCTVIRCETGPMEKDDNVLVQITSRLWISTLLRAEVYKIVISSHGIAQVMSVPYIIKPEEYTLDTFQIDTYAAALNVGPERTFIAFWVIALAIAGGAILFLLLVLLLWRCGFFNRRRAEDMEKLHTNGKSAASKKNGSTATKNVSAAKNGAAAKNGSAARNGSARPSVKHKYDAIPTDQY